MGVQGSGFRVQGAGCKGAGFRVQGSGFRVQGSEFRIGADVAQDRKRFLFEPVVHDAPATMYLLISFRNSTPPST